MHKEILKTKERLEERDQVIMDINKENFMLKEEIAKMYASHDSLGMSYDIT